MLVLATRSLRAGEMTNKEGMMDAMTNSSLIGLPNARSRGKAHSLRAFRRDIAGGAAMSVTFSSLVAILAAVVSLFWVKDLRLPYPCFKVVQTIPSGHIAAPSDLRGLYSVNTHLQKAKKLFEHEIDSAGTPRFCTLSYEQACMQKH